MKSGKKPNSSNDKASIKKQILHLMKHEFCGISTTSELAGGLGISWNTAEKYMLELAIDRKVQRLKKKGVNLWVLRKWVSRSA